jgi:hypothetical protein
MNHRKVARNNGRYIRWSSRAMTKLQSRPSTSLKPANPAPRPTVSQPRYTERDEQILVEHDWISQNDLDTLRREAKADNTTPIALLIERGIYSTSEIDLCLETDDWWKRSAADHHAHVTSEESISAYRHSFSANGWFKIPHFLSREELYAMDVTMNRIAIEHIDENPAKHKLYHSIGPRLYKHRATVDINGHPALTKIAQSFLGDDLAQGKMYLKVDEPYRYNGMFGHTHAETHYDCLTRGLYMFLYMDTTTRECGGFEIIPYSHTWYTRGADGRTQFNGKTLEAESAVTNKASLTHDVGASHRWAGYETLPMCGNTLLVLSPFLWHAVRPVQHRRRLLFTGYFDAKSLTRDFVQRSDYFGAFPYELPKCDLSLLTPQQKALLEIHMDREAWLKKRGL